MSTLDLADMTRHDLVAIVRATEAKNAALQERVGTLEARVRELVGRARARPRPATIGATADPPTEGPVPPAPSLMHRSEAVGRGETGLR